MAKKAETPKLTFADLAKKPLGELTPFVADSVKTYGAINTAKEKFTGMLQFVAMVVAALERIYTERLNKHEVPANTSFKEFLKQNAGGEVPGRVLALANLFNVLCLTFGKDGKPMLSEEFFVNAKVDWLEKANAIIAAERKAHPDNWMGSDNVLDVINALSKPGDAGKTLKEIRKRQKGEPAESAETETGETAAVVLTTGRAIEFLIAAIKNAGKMPASEAGDLFEGCSRVSNAWAESGVSDDQQEKWLHNIHKGVDVNLVVLTEEAKPETAEAEPAKDDIAALVAA